MTRKTRLILDRYEGEHKGYIVEIQDGRGQNRKGEEEYSTLFEIKDIYGIVDGHNVSYQIRSSNISSVYGVSHTLEEADQKCLAHARKEFENLKAVWGKDESEKDFQAIDKTLEEKVK